MYVASLAHALGLAGRRAEALKVMENHWNRANRVFISSYDLAIASLGLGDTAKAFELLSAAVHERSPRVAFLGVDPRFDLLRKDSRFRELLKAIPLQM